jgi:ABC-type multidrug transport system fused ATPase/permease subunit
MENNLSSIKPTLQYIRQQYKRFPKLGLATIFFGILAIVLSLIPAFFYRDIINLLSEASIASTEIAAHAIALLVYILWISISYAISSRLMDYCIITREMDMMEDLNNKVFDYIQKHSFQFFSNNFTGSLVAKIRKGVAGFERFTDTLMRGVVRFVVDCGLILVIIGFQYFRLAVAMFAAICASVWIQYRLFRRASPLQDKANALDTKFMGILSDNITNYLNIKIFSSLKKEATQFAKVNKENATARKKYHYKMTWVWGFARGGAGIVLEIGTIYAAIALRGQGVIAIGIIILLQIYVLRLIRQL